jgi:hypothetical protein
MQNFLASVRNAINTYPLTAVILAAVVGHIL